MKKICFLCLKLLKVETRGKKQIKKGIALF